MNINGTNCQKTWHKISNYVSILPCNACVHNYLSLTVYLPSLVSISINGVFVIVDI